MNYKLKLTMPNGEVIESAIVDAETLDEYQTAYDQSNYNEDLTFTFKHTKGKRIMSGTTCRQCTLDVIEVDQPTEQVQPSEKTNVGKRVEFVLHNSIKYGVVISETDETCQIKFDKSEVVNRFKSQCTILEDQPKSNVGRMVKVDTDDEIYIDKIVYESDKEYVTIDKSGDLFVWDKSNCELLPE